jgi:hypothetical protein
VLVERLDLTRRRMLDLMPDVLANPSFGVCGNSAECFVVLELEDKVVAREFLEPAVVERKPDVSGVGVMRFEQPDVWMERQNGIVVVQQFYGFMPAFQALRLEHDSVFVPTVHLLLLADYFIPFIVGHHRRRPYGSAGRTALASASGAPFTIAPTCESPALSGNRRPFHAQRGRLARTPTCPFIAPTRRLPMLHRTRRL